MIGTSKNAQVIRTCFKNEEAWHELKMQVGKPSKSGFIAYVDFISDRAFDKMTPQQLCASITDRKKKDEKNAYNHSFLFIADEQTLRDKTHPIICMDLNPYNNQIGRTLRLIPRAMWTVENNLSIANSDFDDFIVDANDPNKVYQGYED